MTRQGGELVVFGLSRDMIEFDAEGNFLDVELDGRLGLGADVGGEVLEPNVVVGLKVDHHQLA